MKFNQNAFEQSSNHRLELMEFATKDTEEAREMLSKMRVEFDDFYMSEGQREAYTKYLEAFVKDMEKRVWPWREHMDHRDRSSSPGLEERTALFQDGDPRQPTDAATTEDRPASPTGIPWLPWPTQGMVKANSRTPTTETTLCTSTRPPSDGPTPCTSAWPTPPTSRPSSAQQRSSGNLFSSARPTPPSSRPSSAPFRGRGDPGRVNTIPAGSGSTAVKRVRPSSARSAR